MSNKGGRTLAALDPGRIDLAEIAPLRFRRHLPGERDESDNDRRLIESIERCGVIQPPLLVGQHPAVPGSLLLVQGYRRLAAALEAGLESVDALIIPGGTLSKGEIASLWLEEIPFGEPPSELERIYLTRKAAKFLENETDQTLPGLSKAYERELSKEFLERLWKLLDLEDPALEYLHKGSVSTGDLLLLSEHPFVNTAEAVRLLGGEGLNRREQKDAVRLMLRLGDHGEERWNNFIKEYRSSGHSLPEALGAACHPALTEDLDRIDGIISGIHLPPGAVIQPPGNLEGGSCILSIRIRDEKELSAALQKINEALNGGKIRSLIRILTGEG